MDEGQRPVDSVGNIWRLLSLSYSRGGREPPKIFLDRFLAEGGGVDVGGPTAGRGLALGSDPPLKLSDPSSKHRDAQI